MAQNKYSLYKKVDGELKTLDILSNGGFLITSNDPLNYKYGRSFKTYTIKLANTPNNNLLLDNLWYKRNNWKTIYNVILEVDGVLMNGILNIMSFDDNTASTQFTSTVSLYIEELGNKNLKDFDWSEYDHILTPEILTTSATQDFMGGDIIYDFADRGVGEFMNNTFDRTPRRRRGTPAIFGKYISVAESQPAIRFKTILDKIFEGYTVDYKIFEENSEWNNVFEDLYLLFSNDRQRNTKNWKKNALENAEVNEETVYTFPTETRSISTSPTAFFYNWGKWSEHTLGNVQYTQSTDFQQVDYVTINETGTYNIKANFNNDFKVSVSGNAGNVSIRNAQMYYVIQKQNENGTWSNIRRLLVWTRDVPYFFTDNITYYWDNLQEDIGLNIKWNRITREDVFTTLMEFEEGDNIRAFVEFNYFIESNTTETVQLTFSTTALTESDFDDRCFFDIIPWDGMGGDSEVLGEWIVPDMKVKDFISTFLKLFNAEFHINMERKYILLLNRFNQIPETYDITPFIIPETFNNRILIKDNNWELSYTDDGDIAQQEYWGDKKTGEKLVDLDKFNTTQLTVNNISIITPSGQGVFQDLIPIFRDKPTDEESSYKTTWKPRLAFYNSTSDWEHSIMYLESNNNFEHPASVIPNFTLEKNGVTLDFDTQGGIYNNFHIDNILRQNFNNMVKVDIMLTPYQISQMYYLNGFDLTKNYAMRIEKWEGVYQIISLKQKRDNVYEATLIKVNKFKQPDEIIFDTFGDFNKDFNWDFNSDPTI